MGECQIFLKTFFNEDIRFNIALRESGIFLGVPRYVLKKKIFSRRIFNYFGRLQLLLSRVSLVSG